MFGVAKKLMKNMRKLIFFAQEASFYSAIVRPMLRYKNIPFTETAYAKNIIEKFFDKSGSVQIPQIMTLDGQIIQDTTLICDYLEQHYPEKSMTPITPIQKIISKIIQEFANDFMIMPAMHYRWNFKFTNWRVCYYDFAKLAVPDYLFFLRPFIAMKITPKIEMAYRKMGGLDEDFIPEIEKWYLDFLNKLNIHLAQHRYLLGDRPSIADCALMGPLYAHLGRDAYPKKLMLKLAPNVYEWVKRMNFPDNTDTDYLSNDELPKTLIPILDLIFKHQGEKTIGIIKKTDEYMKKMSDKNELLSRFSGKAKFQLGKYLGTRATEVHIAWLRQKMLEDYDNFIENDKVKITNYLEKNNWIDYFDLRLDQPIKRIRNKYYHKDADENFIKERDQFINQGAFSGGKKSKRATRD